MSTTSDPNDPRLTHGVDDGPVPQAEVYYVLSKKERRKGFVRPLRLSYRHVGAPGPQYPLRDLTDEERERYDNPTRAVPERRYVKFEAYPEGSGHVSPGRFWTEADLDRAGSGCGSVTTMSRDIAESYAVNPATYGATYCAHCSMHLKAGAQGVFVWIEDDGSDGPRVGT